MINSRSMDMQKIPTPSYVIDEGKLEDNCKILHEVAGKAGCKILLAQKAYSAFATYPLIRRYLSGATASGLYEARLGQEEMKGENHVFSPAYSEEEMAELVKICDHISFNSVSQLNMHRQICMENGVSIGLRINPECSTQEHGIYDPCAPFSRLGVTRAMLDEAAYDDLLFGVEGLHIHTLCEQNADALETTLKAFCGKFDDILRLPRIKWLNLGGGHHITREDYDRVLLIRLIREVKEKYNVEVYLEPGEAIALNAGYLVTTVMDIVHNGMPILILDASAACHMPDVIEMPYTPPLRGAEPVLADEKRSTGIVCRLASRTCLAGDIIGDYRFETMPKIGDRLVFEDMAIYSMVKNNTFNGMPLPSIYLMHEDGECERIREFSYEDFKGRLS